MNMTMDVVKSRIWKEAAMVSFNVLLSQCSQDMKNYSKENW